MKKKLIWISPLSHNVYKGWLYFFNSYFDLHIYDNSKIKFGFGKQNKLNIKKTIDISRGNFLNIYSNKIKNNKKDIIIIGDIFTNTLCLSTRGKNVTYYSEFFLRKEDSIFKKILAYLYSFLWYNKKILVPTKKSLEFFRKISNKVLYFPEIYYGDLHDNSSLKDDKLKILFIGKLGEYKKNLDFLLNTLTKLNEKVDFEIGLCGQMEGFENKLEKYKKTYGQKLKYYGFNTQEEMINIKKNHNLFILPSISDPIGAVVLEAMSSSLPIIVSENVGANCYVKEGRNGYVFRNNDQKDLLDKILLLKDKETREKFGNKSLEIIKQEFYYKTKRMGEIKYKNFNNFLLK